MRVLHVSQPTAAGVPRVVADLVADQLARGWEVAVACPDDGGLAAEVRAAGARHHPWRAGRVPGPTTAREVATLRRAIDAVLPDVVHLHSAKAGLAGRLALRGRLPTVFQPHAWSFLAADGVARQLTVAWERTAVRWCDALAVVSEDERREGEQAGVRGPWVHLPNGVDLQRRRPGGEPERSAARQRLGLPRGPLAVCVGRLAPQKGQHVLLDAWEATRAAVPGARLVLVGDGPDRAGLTARAPSDVHLVGGVDRPDDWLLAADVVVLPSRWEAGLSLIAMEAMALGRSVVSTRVAGAADGLGGAGAVVPVGDARALAAEVSRRLLDPELASAEGLRGRQTVEQRFDLSLTTGRAAEVYERLVEARTTASDGNRAP